jgi:hypothetical protein
MSEPTSQPTYVPAHSLYGTPVGGSRLNHLAGARIAAASAPYLGRGNKCSANDDTCEASRVKDTELCFGHTRSAAKVSRVSVETILDSVDK